MTSIIASIDTVSSTVHSCRGIKNNGIDEIAKRLARPRKSDLSFHRVINESPTEAAEEMGQSAEFIESGPIVRLVVSDGRTQFQFFCDGTEESFLLGNMNSYPIVFGAVGACIRQRIDRRLSTHFKSHRTQYLGTEEQE